MESSPFTTDISTSRCPLQAARSPPADVTRMEGRNGDGGRWRGQARLTGEFLIHCFRECYPSRDESETNAETKKTCIHLCNLYAHGKKKSANDSLHYPNADVNLVRPVDPVTRLLSEGPGRYLVANPGHLGPHHERPRAPCEPSRRTARLRFSASRPRRT